MTDICSSFSRGTHLVYRRACRLADALAVPMPGSLFRIDAFDRVQTLVTRIAPIVAPECLP